MSVADVLCRFQSPTVEVDEVGVAACLGKVWRLKANERRCAKKRDARKKLSILIMLVWWAGQWSARLACTRRGVEEDWT